MDVAAMSVTIRNGAYAEECAYGLGVTREDGTAAYVDCQVNQLDCECSVSSDGGSHTARLIGRYLGETRTLDTREVLVQEGECHTITEELSFEQPPIERFLVDSCVEATAHLTTCDRGYVLLPSNCTDTTIEPGETPGSEGTRCTYDCIAAAACDTIQSTICPDGARDAAGGMGGAAGPSTEPSSLVECAVGCDAGLGTEEEAAAGAALLCPSEE